MPKLTEDKMKQIIRALDDADFAINTLERANGNKILFPQTKTSVQKLSEELKNRYSTSLPEGIDDE